MARNLSNSKDQEQIALLYYNTFHLLNMAIEIAEQKQINVRRMDRAFLLRIKYGAIEYDELLQLVKKKQKQRALEKPDLLNQTDIEYI